MQRLTTALAVTTIIASETASRSRSGARSSSFKHCVSIMDGGREVAA